jgi:putative spermidine/putrescine transport system permease protein
LLVVYLGSLFSLLINSFYAIDDFTGLIIREFTLKTYGQIFTPANREIFMRTASMAAAVTMDALIAFPLAYYIAKFASPRLKTWLVIAVTIPLWSSYLVRVYAWKLILAKEGILSWFINLFGLSGVLDWLLSIPSIGGSSLSLSPIGMFIVFSYIWLPYMIIPIQTALERVPGLRCSKPPVTGREAASNLPHCDPAAGISRCCGWFDLHLLADTGRFHRPVDAWQFEILHRAGSLFLSGTGGNIPLAAAMTMGPVVIMVIYLLIARRLGAFDAL